MGETIVAWAATWTSEGGTAVHVIQATAKCEWWAVRWLTYGTVIANPALPQPSPRVSNVQGLTQEDYDLLLAETRARQVLEGG